jgi:hypothetical protein
MKVDNSLGDTKRRFFLNKDGFSNNPNFRIYRSIDY